jgi:hypothetical protein
MWELSAPTGWHSTAARQLTRSAIDSGIPVGAGLKPTPTGLYRLRPAPMVLYRLRPAPTVLFGQLADISFNRERSVFGSTPSMRANSCWLMLVRFCSSWITRFCASRPAHSLISRKLIGALPKS